MKVLKFLKKIEKLNVVCDATDRARRVLEMLDDREQNGKNSYDVENLKIFARKIVTAVNIFDQCLLETETAKNKLYDAEMAFETELISLKKWYDEPETETETETETEMV